MKISAHTFITNPITSGYNAYLPSIQSFLDFADEVIVVDGGSTDDSLERLKMLRGSKKLKIISNETTHWGAGDKWEWAQIGIQRQVGYENCSGDWAIHFDADHILPEFESEKLSKELKNSLNRGIVYAFRVIKFANGKYSRIYKIRRWCVNNKLSREKNIRLVYGAHILSGDLNQVIIPEEEKQIIDPVNKNKKTYYIGKHYPVSKLLNVTLYKYGHFFFTTEQLLYKLKRMENQRAKWKQREKENIIEDKRPYRQINPEEVLSNKNHPNAFREYFKQWLDEFYPEKEDIIGLRYYADDQKKIRRDNLYALYRNCIANFGRL